MTTSDWLTFRPRRMIGRPASLGLIMFIASRPPVLGA
jgi:hypothetical protein